MKTNSFRMKYDKNKSSDSLETIEKFIAQRSMKLISKLGKKCK